MNWYKPYRPVRLWLECSWLGIRSWFRRCPDCDRRGWDPSTPRWIEDPLVVKFKWYKPEQCPGCGHSVSQQKRGIK